MNFSGNSLSIDKGIGGNMMSFFNEADAFSYNHLTQDGLKASPIHPNNKH
jgi:hypothetical protein